MKFCVELLNEKSLLENLVDKKNIKWTNNKKSIEVQFTVKYTEKSDYQDENLQDDFYENDDFSDPFYDSLSLTLHLKMNKLYPEKPPFFMNLKSVGLVKKDENKLKKEVRNAMMNNKGKPVIIDLYWILRTYLDNYDETEESTFVEKSPDVLTPQKNKQFSKKVNDKFLNTKPYSKDIAPIKIKQKKTRKNKIIYTSEKWIPDTGLVKKNNESEYMSEISFHLEVKHCDKMAVDKMILTSKNVHVYDSNAKEYHIEMEEISSLYKTRDNRRNANERKYRTDERLYSDVVKNLRSSGLNKFVKVHLSENDKRLSNISKRKNYSLEVRGNYVFIFGGETNRICLNDLIRFDLKNEMVHIYNNLHEFPECCESHGSKLTRRKGDYLLIPPMSNHKMVYYRSGLFIFGTHGGYGREYDLNERESISRWNYRPYNGMKFYFISNVASKEPFYGIMSRENGRILFRHPYPVKVNQSLYTIPLRECFTANVVGHEIFFFGGKSIPNGGVCNNLYSISFEDNRHVVIREVLKKDTKYDKETQMRLWPAGRYNHSSCNVYHNLYIYGGIGNDAEIFNDLWMYDCTKRKWSEIRIEGSLLPPKLMSFGAFHNGKSGFTLFGGLKKHQDDPEKIILSKDMYAYDMRENKFFLLENNSTSEYGEAFERFDFGCVKSDSYAFFLGGNQKEKISDEVFIIDHPNDIGKELILLKYLKESKAIGMNERTRSFVDVCFKVSKGKDDKGIDEKIDDLCAHLCILSCRCPKLVELVNKSGKMVGKDDSMIMEVIIGDYSASVFEAFLNYLYCGEIKLKGVENVKSFVKLSEAYLKKEDMKMVRRICYKKKRYLDTCGEILNLIKNDFKKLLRENETFEGEEKNYSDLQLVFGDMSKLKVHKLFLCRSGYFESMLKSSFKESITSEINFERFNKNAILDILNFLYTDRLEMEPSNCVGVLIYSLQFQLKVISNYCRRIVEEFLTEDNVIDLICLAELYHDTILKNMIVRFISIHYEKISLDKNYGKIELETRNVIMKRYTKKKARDLKKSKNKVKRRFQD